MARRLFVGNLPYSTTEDELKDLFAARWPVAEVRVVTDRDTGRSRGFAFVELATEEAASEAISSMDGNEHGGRRLAVREAHDRRGGRGHRGNGGPPPGRGGRRHENGPIDGGSRGGGFRGGPPRGPRPNGGRRGPPPMMPPPEMLEPPPGFDDGGKSRRRRRRKQKKRDRQDSDW